MFVNVLQLFTRRAAAEDYERAFVEDVQLVTPRVGRRRRSERIIAVGWVLVGLKCWGVVWLVQTYHDRMSFGAWWINGPTLAAATLTTLVYLRRP